MKILLFGKTGQLGWELQRTLAPLGSVFAYGPDELDLADLKSLERVIKETQPDLVVNASAYTAVDQAELEPDLAMLINAKAPGVMAETARSLNAVLIHYSTDYVFDGEKGSAYTEDDPPNPLNVYGQSKLEGETAIGQAGGVHVILRTSWVYSVGGGGFVSKILSWARKQETMRIVTDQVGSPTWARMLAEASAVMVARSQPSVRGFFSERCGIYHLGGSGTVSRFDFTKAVLELDPNPEEQIVKRILPALTVEFPSPARRPLVTPLDCSRFERVFGVRLPVWDETLRLAMGK
ncbi:MAG: dTDP-4-dehydrorhamnose reductase [Chloroflexi bacterium]|nr:dTDP-4-dehydrorhamnose reductase [Chloroflexota bacterium]